MKHLSIASLLALLELLTNRALLGYLAIRASAYLTHQIYLISTLEELE